MSKYHNKKITADNIVFDSLAEHRRYCELLLLQAAGEISGLEVHVRYPLMVKDAVVGYYEADFVYLDGYDSSAQRRVVEDVKGVRTALYKLKKKMFKAEYGIDIQEVNA